MPQLFPLYFNTSLMTSPHPDQKCCTTGLCCFYSCYTYILKQNVDCIYLKLHTAQNIMTIIIWNYTTSKRFLIKSISSAIPYYVFRANLCDYIKKLQTIVCAHIVMHKPDMDLYVKGIYILNFKTVLQLSDWFWCQNRVSYGMFLRSILTFEKRSFWNLAHFVWGFKDPSHSRPPVESHLRVAMSA